MNFLGNLMEFNVLPKVFIEFLKNRAEIRWLYAKVMDRQVLHRSDEHRSQSPVSLMTRVWELDGGNSLWVAVIIFELKIV